MKNERRIFYRQMYVQAVVSISRGTPWRNTSTSIDSSQFS